MKYKVQSLKSKAVMHNPALSFKLLAFSLSDRRERL